MFKALALAAVTLVAATSFAEAQQRGYGQRGGYGYQQRGGYNQQFRGNGNFQARQYRGGNYNNSFNRNVYVKNGGNGNAWAAGAAGLVVGGLLGALAAQPSYAAPVQQYAPAPVGVVPGINNVPGCYYAAFVDIYGRQFFQQICN